MTQLSLEQKLEVIDQAQFEFLYETKEPGCQWTCCLEGHFFFHLQVFIFCCFQLIIHNLKILLCRENELSSLTFHAKWTVWKIWHLWVYISKCYKGKRNQALLRMTERKLCSCRSSDSVLEPPGSVSSSGTPAHSHIPAQWRVISQAELEHHWPSLALAR